MTFEQWWNEHGKILAAVDVYSLKAAAQEGWNGHSKAAHGGSHIVIAANIKNWDFLREDFELCWNAALNAAIERSGEKCPATGSCNCRRTMRDLRVTP